MSNAENQSQISEIQFVQSEMFARLFRDGMALVEETANYLDGAGRKASKSLSREAALAYASASMRLTTELMQIASWLLVLRAVREGEMAITEAADPKYRLEHSVNDNPDGMVDLPENLVRLIENARQLHNRIARVDAEIFRPNSENKVSGDAVAQQRALLNAFRGR